MEKFLLLPGRQISYRGKIDRFLGCGRNATILFSQAWFWFSHTNNPKGFYKSAASWEYETNLSYKEQWVARKKLEERGFLKTYYCRRTHRMFFRVLYEKFNQEMMQWKDTVPNVDEPDDAPDRHVGEEFEALFGDEVSEKSARKSAQKAKQKGAPSQTEGAPSKLEGGTFQNGRSIYIEEEREEELPPTPHGGFTAVSANAPTSRAGRVGKSSSTGFNEEDSAPPGPPRGGDITDAVREAAAAVQTASETKRLNSVSKTKQVKPGAKITAKEITAAWVDVMRKHHPTIPVPSTAQTVSQVGQMNSVLREALRVASLYDIFDFVVGNWQEIRTERFSRMAKPLPAAPSLGALRGLWSYGFDAAFAERAAYAARRDEHDKRAESETAKLRMENKRQAAELAAVKRTAAVATEKATREERLRIASERDLAASRRVGKGKVAKTLSERLAELPDDLYDNVEIPEWGAEDE